MKYATVSISQSTPYQQYKQNSIFQQLALSTMNLKDWKKTTPCRKLPRHKPSPQEEYIREGSSSEDPPPNGLGIFHAVLSDFKNMKAQNFGQNN